VPESNDRLAIMTNRERGLDMFKRLAVTLGVVVLLATTGGTASAQSKCQGSKIKDAGKKAACLAGLNAKLVAAGTGTLDPAKVAKCQAKVLTAYPKLEAKPGCNTTGDSTAIENKVDAFIDDLVTELGGGPASKCNGSKIKDAGKKAACKAGLQAKLAAAGTGTLDPAKVAKCEAKVLTAYPKLEAKPGCNTTGDSTAIENKVDAFIDDLVTELNVGPVAACSATTKCEIVTTSSPGTLIVSTLPAFPFPPNVLTTVDLGLPDGNAKRTGIVPPGGFTVPVFCIPGLMYTSQVTALGCAAGGADGSATVWETTAPTPDPNVSRVGDTSDGVCNPAAQPCNTLAGSAGANTLGNINTTRGGGAAVPTGVVHTQVDIPVNSLTWQAVDASCPDTDGTFDPGNDTQVTNFNFILSPTTGHSTATYTDLNGDSCSRAGNGPNSQSLTGSAAPGPGCVVGQATTVVATGIAFTGSSPLYDITFASTTPTTISACNLPSSSATCTLSTDPCQD
jgi:hypothetical protein